MSSYYSFVVSIIPTNYDRDYDLNGKMNSKELNSKGEPYTSHQVMTPLGSFVSCHKMGMMLADAQNSFLK